MIRCQNVPLADRRTEERVQHCGRESPPASWRLLTCGLCVPTGHMLTLTWFGLGRDGPGHSYSSLLGRNPGGFCFIRPRMLADTKIDGSTAGL